MEGWRFNILSLKVYVFVHFFNFEENRRIEYFKLLLDHENVQCHREFSRILTFVLEYFITPLYGTYQLFRNAATVINNARQLQHAR